MKPLDQASLSRGLAMEQMPGANPHAHGMIGSSDEENVPERAYTSPIRYHSD